MTLYFPSLSTLLFISLTVASAHTFGQDTAPEKHSTSTDSLCSVWFETYPVQGPYDNSKPKAEARLCKEGETDDKITVRVEARPINGGVKPLPALGEYHLKVEFWGMPQEDGEYPIILISDFNQNGYISPPFAMFKHQEMSGNVLDWDDEAKLFYSKWKSGDEGHVPSFVFEMQEVKVR